MANLADHNPIDLSFGDSASDADDDYTASVSASGDSESEHELDFYTDAFDDSNKDDEGAGGDSNLDIDGDDGKLE